MEHLTHDCDGILLACMDWRIHDGSPLFREIIEKTGVENFDVVTLAGGSRNLVDESTRELILKQIEISRRLHHSTKVVLTNHTTCGAYGEAGTRDKLIADLKSSAEIVAARFPDADIHLLLMNVEAGEGGWDISYEVVMAAVA